MNRYVFVKLIKVAAGVDEAVGYAVNDLMDEDQAIEILARVANRHPETVRQELEDADWPV